MTHVSLRNRLIDSLSIRQPESVGILKYLPFSITLPSANKESPRAATYLLTYSIRICRISSTVVAVIELLDTNCWFCFNAHKMDIESQPLRSSIQLHSSCIASPLNCDSLLEATIT